MVFTITEVAEKLNCNRMTVYRLVKNGTIKSFKIGSDYRIKEVDLNEFMNRGE